jgi:hypothetical protein
MKNEPGDSLYSSAGGTNKGNSRVAEKARTKSKENVKLLRGIFLPKLAGKPADCRG